MRVRGTDTRTPWCRYTSAQNATGRPVKSTIYPLRGYSGGDLTLLVCVLRDLEAQGTTELETAPDPISIFRLRMPVRPLQKLPNYWRLASVLRGYRDTARMLWILIHGRLTLSLPMLKTSATDMKLQLHHLKKLRME